MTDVLIMIVSDNMNIIYKKNIMTVVTNIIEPLKIDNIHCEIAIISSHNDINNYNDCFDNIAYKVINPKFQLSKVCDFLSTCKKSYDWYIKYRPDIELVETITLTKLNSLCKNSVNARVREYIGNKKILYGSSLGGVWLDIKNTIYGVHYAPEEKHIILDNAIYIFNNNIVKCGGFKPIDNEYINGTEYFFTNTLITQNIKLNPCGIHIILHHRNVGDVESSHVNI
jgi:hypothetical protein